MDLIFGVTSVDTVYTRGVVSTVDVTVTALFYAPVICLQHMSLLLW